jgi:ubiquinone biosynthesis protein UbiJ
MAQGLERAINTALSLDPESKSLLAAHSGKIVQIEITSLNTCCYLQLLPEKLMVLTTFDDQVDTVIKGNFFAFINQVVPLAETPEQSNAIVVEGDTELAHDIQRLMKNFDSHWEDYASFVVGDTATQNMSQAWQWLKTTVRTITRRAREDTQEYIQEEQSFVPTREEVEDFYDDVTLLRQDIDRLEARWQRLQERNSSK